MKIERSSRIFTRHPRDKRDGRLDLLFVHPGAELYGSDRMLVESIRACTDAGLHTMVVTPEAGPLVPMLETAGATVAVIPTLVLRKNMLHPRAFPKLVASTIRSVWRSHRLLRQARPQVIVCNTITQSYWLLIARIRGIRTVCHVREAENTISPVLNEVLLTPLLAAEVLIANSKATSSYLTNSRVLQRRLPRVIYNGKDWKDYPERDWPRSTSPTRLVLVGRLSPRKGQDIAVRAVASLRDAGIAVTLDLYGDAFPGYEWYREELKSIIRSERIDDRVHLRGFVEDVTQVFRETDIAIVPSRIEPFGTVAAESMASGTLTIVSNVQGLVEIVEDGVNGLVFDSEDFQQLARLVAEVVARPNDYSAVVAAGTKDIRDRFSLGQYRVALLDTLSPLQRSKA